MKTRWLVDTNVNRVEANKIAESVGIPEIIVEILMKRNIVDEDDIRNFVFPQLSNMYDPFLLKDIDLAVSRIMKAIDKKEKVMIFGDYDADGITSTSIMYKFLEQHGLHPYYYIPNRMNDGYGLSSQGIEFAVNNAVDLIITVDCGITGFAEVEYAGKKGIDVIITDHHEVTSELPKAFAVVNPHRPDDPYPFKSLAGCGVVMKLIQALLKRMNENEKEIDKFLDFVALGTIADVVPLVDENRIIIYYGLKKLAESSNPGIKALCSVADIKLHKMTSYHIGYVLAPRINAIGRMTDASDAVKLFITEEQETAHTLSVKLNEENRKRQEIDQQVFEEAVKMIEEDKLYEKNCIIISSENWHEGVIGIVSSRLVEKYYRPVIMITLYDDSGKGSGRSIPNFHLYNALMRVEDILESFGGHKLAAGISIKRANLNEFKKRFEHIASEIICSDDMVKNIEIDAEINLNQINEQLEDALKNLAPFGYGNPKPIFVSKEVNVIGYPILFKDRHLRFVAEQKGKIFDAIWFNSGKEIANRMVEKMVESKNLSVDIVYTVSRNEYQGKSELQLQLKDLSIN